MSLLLCRQTRKTFLIQTGSLGLTQFYNVSLKSTEPEAWHACRVIDGLPDLIPRCADWKYDEWLSIFYGRISFALFSFFFCKHHCANECLRWLASDADEKLLSRFFSPPRKNFAGRNRRACNICICQSVAIWTNTHAGWRRQSEESFFFLQLRDKTRKQFSVFITWD